MTVRLPWKAVALALTVGLCQFLSPQALAQPVFTGAVQFSTNAAGAAAGGQVWNTLGGDGNFNLYMTSGGLAASFLNSGDGLGARINVPLALGTSTFSLFGEPGTDPGNFGLNLFFNGNDTTPRISVFAPTDLPPSPPFPAFSANGSPATLQLNAAVVAGAGTLAFVDGGFIVTLTDYRWSRPDVENLNRVLGFNNVPGGGNDFVGQFTLTVAAVPEPGTLALLGAGLVAATVTWKQRRRSKRARSAKTR